MKQTSIFFTGLFVTAILLMNCGQQQQTDVLTANKQIVADFIQKVWHEKDTNAINKLVHQNYVQHNPMSADKPESIKMMFNFLSPKINTLRSIAEGDLVLLHNDSKGWGDTTHWVSFDVFRIKNNQIIEHWDVMQTYAYSSASGHSMIDGETKIIDKEKTEANKKLVEDFYNDVFYGGHFENLTKYLSAEKYIQHNPSAKDGVEGLMAVLKSMQKKGITMKMIKTYRFIAEGNFVFVHSLGEFASKPAMFGDLFRVENGKIVEHWDCIQDEVPASKSKSGHDMYSQISE